MTDELLHSSTCPIVAAPVFPSLFQEGRAGGGWDVMVRHGGVPLFIQFKLSECMTRNNAAEARSCGLAVPYYRMHFRSRSHSNQHALLLELEAVGNCVYYCAPAFHRDHELNDAFLAKAVCERSLWFSPASIGQLPDDDAHCAAFQRAGVDHFYFCSKPRRVSATTTFSTVVRNVLSAYDKQNIVDMSQKSDRFVKEIEEGMLVIAFRQNLLALAIAEAENYVELTAIQRVAVLAHAVLGSQLYITSPKSS